MKITLGRVLSVVVLVAAVALAAWALLPKPIPVETAMATKGNFVATVDEDGKTRVRERYVVAAPLAGRLTRVRLKVGDAVKADDAVATILPSPAPFLDPRSRQEAEERLGAAEAARERTRAMVERAQAQTAQAKKDLDRTRTLKESGTSTTQALERAETVMRVAERDLRAAQFQDHAAEHEIEQAKVLLTQFHNGNGGAPPDRWTMTAPVSGLVLKVAQESETVVQAGTPILEIGDPRDLEVVVDGNVLSIRGERPDPRHAEKRSYHEARIPYGAFGADVFVPFAVDADKTSAEYNNGFLRIVLPRAGARTIVPKRPGRPDERGKEQS